MMGKLDAGVKMGFRTKKTVWERQRRFEDGERADSRDGDSMHKFRREREREREWLSVDSVDSEESVDMCGFFAQRQAGGLIPMPRVFRNANRKRTSCR